MRLKYFNDLQTKGGTLMLLLIFIEFCNSSQFEKKFKSNQKIQLNSKIKWKMSNLQLFFFVVIENIKYRTQSWYMAD